MSEIFDEIKEKVKDFPTQSGVYLMKNEVDKVIYVGKAKILRNRVRSYFQNLDHSGKTKILIQNIRAVEYIITKTEVEAFLLEASLIKKYKPKYNIRLRDDKSYPYIRLSWKENYPRLLLSRKVKKDSSIYFGPYTSGYAVSGTIRFLNRTFKIRDCSDSMFKSRKRPCLTYQIGRCSAPCVGYISESEYRQEIEGALLFLKGQNRKVIKALTEKMMSLADEEKFEPAAKLRDSIKAMKSVLEKQSVINAQSDRDQDVITYHGDERGCVVETLHIRQGNIIGNRSHFLNLNPEDPNEDEREWFVSFINQYYDENIIPDIVLVGSDFGTDLMVLLAKVLETRADRVIKVRFPTDEKGRQLMEMCSANAKSHFEKEIQKNEEKYLGLDEIKEKLGLVSRPQRIECYDISNFQGSENVASQVVFEDGAPAKENYRRFKIKTVEGQNDFASMYEVISRRFQHTEWEDPQLIVVDGGKGQLSQAVKILQELNKKHIPVVGLAKARTDSDFRAENLTQSEERVFIPGRQNPVSFRKNSEGLNILINIRDEAHRFAITFHRKLREEKNLESELDFVVGLGEKRKKILLTHFDSIEDLRIASAEEIARLKGFSKILAERILLQLNEDDDIGES